MRTWIGIVLLVGWALLAGVCPSPTRGQRLEDRVVEHKLSNGMKLLLMERSQAPVVSAVIRFKVGSVDEPEGKSGLAHLYEHLAFRGTETIGTKDYEREVALRARIDSLAARRSGLLESRSAGDDEAVVAVDRAIEDAEAELAEIVVVEELDEIYNRNGAVGLDASTTADLTTFTVDLPANRLPLWAILESDRMAHSVPREFEVERRICAEERSTRIDDNPESSLYRKYLATAFRVHPYGRPIPGREGELESVTLEEAKVFYSAYYSPANAVAAIAGDIDVEGVIALAETTFGRVPRREMPGLKILAGEPPQREKRVVMLERDAEPALFLGFHKPNLAHPTDGMVHRPGTPNRDDLVFEVLSEILTRGNTSRLYQALFVETQIAVDMASWMGPGDRFPNLFTIAARPIWPHTPEEVEGAIWAELERLKEEPVLGEELRRAKNRLAADFSRRLHSNRGMAEALSYYESVLGDWRYLEDRLSLVESISAEEVRECTRRYFTPRNATAAILHSERQVEDE